MGNVPVHKPGFASPSQPGPRHSARDAGIDVAVGDSEANDVGDQIPRQCQPRRQMTAMHTGLYCDTCKKGGFTSRSLPAHVFAEYSVKISCPHCQLDCFATREGLVKHIGPIHRHFPYTAHVQHEPRDDADSIAAATHLMHTPTSATLGSIKRGRIRSTFGSNRPVNRDAYPVQCPFPEDCTIRFASVSSVLSYIEGISCTSGTTREKLYENVLKHDAFRDIATVSTSKAHGSMETVNGSAEVPTAAMGSDRDGSWRASMSAGGGSFGQSSRSSSYVPFLRAATSNRAQGSKSLPLSHPMIEGGDNARRESRDCEGDVGASISRTGIRNCDPPDGPRPIDLSTRRYTVQQCLALRERLAKMNAKVSPTASPTNPVPIDSAFAGLWSCPLCSRVYDAKYSLTQHLESAAHAKVLFQCPTVHSYPSRRGGFPHGSKTLSGCVQHLELGHCAGASNLLHAVLGIVEEELMQAGGTKLMQTREG